MSLNQYPHCFGKCAKSCGIRSRYARCVAHCLCSRFQHQSQNTDRSLQLIDHTLTQCAQCTLLCRFPQNLTLISSCRLLGLELCVGRQYSSSILPLSLAIEHRQHFSQLHCLHYTDMYSISHPGSQIPSRQCNWRHFRCSSNSGTARRCCIIGRATGRAVRHWLPWNKHACIGALHL